jgi:hypothetical protein
MIYAFIHVLNSAREVYTKNFFLIPNYFLQFLYYRNRDYILEIILSRN